MQPILDMIGERGGRGQKCHDVWRDIMFINTYLYMCVHSICGNPEKDRDRVAALSHSLTTPLPPYLSPSLSQVGLGQETRRGDTATGWRPYMYVSMYSICGNPEMYSIFRNLYSICGNPDRDRVAARAEESQKVCMHTCMYMCAYVYVDVCIRTCI